MTKNLRYYFNTVNVTEDIHVVKRLAMSFSFTP